MGQRRKSLIGWMLRISNHHREDERLPNGRRNKHVKVTTTREKTKWPFIHFRARGRDISHTSCGCRSSPAPSRVYLLLQRARRSAQGALDPRSPDSFAGGEFARAADRFLSTLSSLVRPGHGFFVCVCVCASSSSLPARMRAIPTKSKHPCGSMLRSPTQSKSHHLTYLPTCPEPREVGAVRDSGCREAILIFVCLEMITPLFRTKMVLWAPSLAPS